MPETVPLKRSRRSEKRIYKPEEFKIGFAKTNIAADGDTALFRRWPVAGTSYNATRRTLRRAVLAAARWAIFEPFLPEPSDIIGHSDL